MKFKISVQHLQYALRMVKDLKLPSGPLEDTTSVLVNVSPEEIVMSAYNGEALVRCSSPVSSDFTGSFVIDASVLFSAVSAFHPLKDEFGTSDVQFTLSNDYKKLVIATKTKYKNGQEIPHKRTFSLSETSGFPDFSAIGELATTFKTKAAYLADGVDSAAYALSGDKSNIIFTGMLFFLEENRLWQVATNGLCLAEYAVPVEYAGTPMRVIVPGAVASRIARCFSEDEEVDVCLTPKHIFVKTPHLLIGGPLIREEFPDYRSVLAIPDKHVLIDKQMLLDNILNLSYEVSSAPDSRISLVMKSKQIQVKTALSDNEGIPVDGFDGEITIDCNLKMLVSSIKNIYGSQVRMGFSAPEAIVHFYSTETLETGATFSSALVPLRAEIV